MHPWEEQLNRARRWYERFKELNGGINPTMPSENYIDDALAFFMFCYHIKDYLKHDPAYSKHSNPQIEAHVSNTPMLALCGDICNGLKHLKLDPTKTGDQPKFGKREFRVAVTHNLSGPNPPDTLAISLAIEHAGTTLDAFQVATDAMQEWEAFVK